MRLNRPLAVAWLLPLLILGVAGCGTTKLVPVSGVVTLDNTPLAEVRVSFTSEDGSRTAVGETDANGRFRLTTFKPNDGVPPGMYKVTVVSVPKDLGKAEGVLDPKLDPRQRLEMAAKAAKEKTKQASAIHANYTNLKTTPLRQVVPPDGEVTIPLTKQGT